MSSTGPRASFVAHWHPRKTMNSTDGSTDGNTRIVAGAEIGAYRIEKLLGEGGMGAVYRALDTKLNRPVAIKFLSDRLADAAGRRRFQREAQMASSLNHPHILTVYDVGELEGRQYLVTELVDGGALDEWAVEKRTWRQIVELTIGVADGLAAAHAAGILHRDIKPGNVLVARNGYAKLADFGLAKLYKTEEGPAGRLKADSTVLGAVIGTAAYMSPEQACGRPLDARSDIFSFGVVLYELLARRRAFGGATEPDVLAAIVNTAPEPLPDEVPLGLRMLVEKALEKEPRERYQSMQEIVVDLRRLQRLSASQPLRAAAPRVRSPSWRWTALASLALAALAAAAGAWLASRPAPVPENPLANARFTRLTDFAGAEDKAAISPDGGFVAFRADRDGGQDVFVTQIGAGAFVNLTNGANLVVDDITLRGIGFTAGGSELWTFGPTVATGRLRILPVLGGPARLFLGELAVNPSWSPDGRRLAYHLKDQGDSLFVAESTGANPRRIFVNPTQDGHNHFPTYSPDGRWIYFVSGVRTTLEMDLWRIPDSGGTPERLTHHASNVSYPAPIGGNIVLYLSPASDGSGPWLWALDVERKTTTRVSFGLERYTSLHASADGRRLVATVSNPTASLLSVPIADRVVEERDVEAYPLPTVRALAPRFAGESLFYLSSSGAGDGLWLYKDGEAREVWKGADGALSSPPGVAPDGDWATIVLPRAGKPQLHLISADGAELKALAESIAVQGTASFSPDGAWIVTGGSDAEGPGLFKIPMDGSDPVRLTADPGFNPVWSPKGDLIVYAGPSVAGLPPLLAVRPDGTSVDLPEIRVVVGGQRYRFLPDGTALVYMEDPIGPFRLLDLATMQTRDLAQLSNLVAMQTFDITPDGQRIVFDRLQDNSDIVLIDLRPEG
jgi:Tol biopolymer transport system component/tRNA A-37 threonylcarbamoyl transferase component Bud32